MEDTTTPALGMARAALAHANSLQKKACQQVMTFASTAAIEEDSRVPSAFAVMAAGVGPAVGTSRSAEGYSWSQGWDAL